ncbi:MAG: hypothetical protein AB7C89_03385 [Intestinibacillus sp.]
MDKTRFVTRGGLLTALSLALLYLAAIVPAGQVGLCAAAGVIPAAPLSHRRVALGASVYAASALLSFLILPKKSVAFAYTAVFGAYTLVKYAAEKLHSRILQWGCKLACAGAALVLATLAVPAFVAPAVRLLPDTLGQSAAVAVAVILYFVIFAMYDIAFSRLITLLRRIFPSG